MKTEEQNIAISKVMGRKPGQYYCSVCRECVPIETVTSGGYHSKCGGAVHLDLPDFTSDLNACHDMEKFIPDHKRGFYNAELSKIAANRNLSSAIKEPQFIFDCIHANSAQRAKAFLIVCGLWQDDPAKSS